MQGNEKDPVMSRLVRIGTVTSVDEDKRTARVKFQDSDSPSGPLYVLASRPYIPDYNGTQETEEKAGGSGAAAYETHKHSLKIKPWLPKVNAVVLVLYLPVPEGDGFILGEMGELGGLKQWEDQ